MQEQLSSQVEVSLWCYQQKDWPLDKPENHQSIKLTFKRGTDCRGRALTTQK